MIFSRSGNPTSLHPNDPNPCSCGVLGNTASTHKSVQGQNPWKTKLKILHLMVFEIALVLVLQLMLIYNREFRF